MGWGCEWTCWKPERGLSRGRAWPGADKEGLDIAGSEGGGSRGNHGFPRAENGRARIVITGMGALTPLGNDFESSWSNLIAGQSGAAPITHFDAGEYSVHFACELKEFDPTEWIDRKQARRMDRFAQMIVAAARQAEADSGLDIAKESDRIGASVATGIGGLQAYQDCYDTLRERGPTRVNPFSIPAIIPNMGAAWVSMQLGTKGPLMSQCTACAAGNMAIGESIDAIRLGRADVMLCGGTEAPVTEIGIAGFSAMRALSRRNAAPEKASRPFDAGRDGFVMGEAGAILVIEELEHARARGAKIYAELVGYGISSDATHITEPDPTGQNPARAMQMAMADAGLTGAEIGYINAHGTSTPLGDASETRVIKLAVGEERAREIPISSTKGATGHTLGASGAVEAIFTTLAVQRGIVPPTINYEEPDPECDLDYIPNEAREAADLRYGMSNSFGFGGHNASIVVARYDE
ncbi:MAG TPA: beta-ketoacyl-ACP synthase II [Gaiellaceae bacterium]